MTWEVRKFVEEAKLKTNYGPAKMKLLVKRRLGLDISTTIIYRYYRKRKLIRKPQRRLPWYEPIKEKITVSKPGQGVQMNIKYVYVRGKRNFQFSVFDPYSKQYFFLVFPRKESRNAITTFQKAERYFGFRIASVQSDNGSEFRGCFHVWLARKEIRHYFIPKKSPWWNANVERVHRTIDEEYYHNPKRIWNSPYEWLRYYNKERIHLSLNGLTPYEKYLEGVTIDC